MAVLLLPLVASAGGEAAPSFTCLLVALSLSHTVVSFVPATLVGAPEVEAAASALPAHRLLREGRGLEAVELAVLGCLVGFGCALALLPAFLLFLRAAVPGGALSAATPWVLLAVAAVVVGTETRTIGGSRAKGVGAAALVFLLSALLGFGALRWPLDPVVNAGEGTLLPLLSGLFGLPGLLLSASGPPPPPQKDWPVAEARGDTARSGGLGALFASALAILPGTTAGVAAILALTARRAARPEQAIVATAAAASAGALFTVLAFVLVARARSGAMLVVERVLAPETWSHVLPSALALSFLASATVGLLVGSVVAPPLARTAWRRLRALPHRSASLCVAAFVAGLCFAFGGLPALALLAVATLVGLLPWKLGLRRTHLLGATMAPVLSWLA